jgi:hypothetical protein
MYFTITLWEILLIIRVFFLWVMHPRDLLGQYQLETRGTVPARDPLGNSP